MPKWMSIWITVVTAAFVLLSGKWLVELSNEYVNTKIHKQKQQCNNHIDRINTLWEANQWESADQERPQSLD